MNIAQQEALNQNNARQHLQSIAQSVKFDVNPIIQRALHMFTGGQGGGNPFYKEGNIRSVGGRMGPVGATVGMEGNQPFGSFNVKGQTQGSFGPQDPGDPVNPIINKLLLMINPLKQSMSIAQDTGAGIRAGQASGDLDKKEQLAQMFEAKGDYKSANMIREQLSGEANDISQGFSDNVGQNPIARGAMGGLEIGSTAAIISSLIQMLAHAPATAVTGSKTSVADVKSQMARDANLNKIPLESSVSPPYQAPTPGVDSWVQRAGSINDPKESAIRNILRSLQYAGEATGRIR